MRVALAGSHVSRLMRSVVVACVLGVTVLGVAVAPGGVAAGAVSAPGHVGQPGAAPGVVGSAGRDGRGMRAAGGAVAGIKVKYPCTSITKYGSVLVKPSWWAKGLVNTGHDGANFNVYSNYASGSCDRLITQPPNGSDAWGTKYQCAELAIRVADAEWATGSQAAWVKAGWDGSAADMQAPGQALGLTWTANGSGTLPAPGDLMIWSSSGNGDPGHVAVVSAVTAQA